MNPSLHDLFHYIGQDQHFHVAKLILLIYTILVLIAGMMLCFLIWLLVGKLFRYDKYPVSFDDLAHSVNGFRPWKIFGRKKKQIVRSLIALLVFSSLISCTKTALVPQVYKSVHQKWIVQEGHDRTLWDAAQFCYAQDYGVIDTIDLYYSAEPNNPNKFGYMPGSIYFHQSGGRIPTDIPDIYDRYYCKLLQQTE